MTITRNYGETAEEKSDELLLHMGIAVVGVALLILLTLGWRESWIVFTAVPITRRILSRSGQARSAATASGHRSLAASSIRTSIAV